MKTLVTGGAGFIGSHIVDLLVQKGHQVVIVDNLSTGKKENINKKAKFYFVDIREEREVKDIFKKEKPEAVFHLAAQTSTQASIREPLFDAQVNVLGTLNLIESFLELYYKKKKTKGAPRPKFIFTSSGGVLYGEADIFPTPESHPLRPISPYGISKLTGENYLRYYFRSFGLNFISLRYSNVYGPRQDEKGEAGVVAIFTGRILQGKPCIIYGDGNQTRDYIYVKDVARANAVFLEKETKNWQEEERFLNVGIQKETSVNELYQILSTIIKKEVSLVYKPARQGDVYRSVLDISKIKEATGWNPQYPLEKGIKETITWFSNRG